MTAFAKNKEIHSILTTESIVEDPLLAKGYQQFQVLNLFLDTLVRKDTESGIISGIAKSWKVSDDQKTYTFNLSEKALFQNGDKILPEDIVFSFDRHLKKGSAVSSYLKNILIKIEPVNTSGVSFVLKGPYPPFLELISMSGFGIISKKSKDGNIIGSGPYAFITKENQKWCLQKTPKYPFPTSNVEKYCFQIERDVEKTVSALNENRINLAMGSPLEVALSKKLSSNFVSSPTFSLVTTHIIINHNNPFFRSKDNRKLISDIVYKVRMENVLTKFDSPLDTYLPKGIMPKSYYSNSHAITTSPQLKEKQKIKIVFPYGIFLEESVRKIVHAFEKSGFQVSYINVKGKELLQPILDGDFDLIFIPYQGVVSDPDGYLDLLDPESVLKKANIPAGELLKSLTKNRFQMNKEERLRSYEREFNKFEGSLAVIPFSQNSIPIVHSKSIKLPDLNFSFHLNLRELNLSNEE